MSTPSKEKKTDFVTFFLYSLPAIGMLIAVVVFFSFQNPPPPPPATLTASPFIIIQTRIIEVTSTPIPVTETLSPTPVVASVIPSPSDTFTFAETPTIYLETPIVLFSTSTETPLFTLTPTSNP